MGAPADPSGPEQVPARRIAEQAHRADARLLMESLRGADRDDLPEIRQAFAQWVLADRRSWPSWQDAWNAWAAAPPESRVRYHKSRCGQCRGKGFNIRSMARTGSAVCHECMGSGRGGMQTAIVTPVRTPGG